MSRRLHRILLVVIATGLAFAAATWLRKSYGVEFESESIRSFVASLGPAAPLVFTGLIAFRPLFMVPSQIALVLAGICFGAAYGALIGGAGLMGGGLIYFGIARYTGQQAFEDRFDERFHRFLELASGRGGVLFVAFMSGYPIAPLTPTHVAAGITRMPWLAFGTAALIGGIIRAATFTFFGAALLEDGRTALLAALAVFALAILVPLAHPRPRAWIRQALRPPPDPATTPATEPPGVATAAGREAAPIADTAAEAAPRLASPARESDPQT